MKTFYLLLIMIIGNNFQAVCQIVGVQYLDPMNTSSSYHYIRIGDESEYFAGFMNNYNSTTYGDGNDFSIFTYGDRDLTFRTGTGNIIFFPSSGGNVGIGTTSPGAKVDIAGNSELLRLTYTNSAGFIRGYKSGSKHWYVGAGSSGNDDVHFANYRNASLILMTNSSYRLKILGNGNVGIGNTNPTEKLVVDGKILAEEVKVQTVPASDYVFEPDYNLKSLTEVESFIQQNKHLPDIPSAKEFKENGVGLGEMDDMLLRKVEELTLYMITMEKEIQDLKEQNEQLASKLNENKN